MMKLKQGKKRSKKKVVKRLSSAERAVSGIEELDGRIELIQRLIPLGLEHVNMELQAEVCRLVGGSKYERSEGVCSRWGSNPGSVLLGGHKIAIEVPRVRDMSAGKEVELESYRLLKESCGFEESVFRQLINGISAGRYEEASQNVPGAFGMSRSSVSRSFKKATVKKLKELCERDLSELDIVAMFLDGKSLSGADMVIALGITITGEKVVLGFIETSTENAEVCSDFIHELIARGLNTEQEILCIVDGSKGLSKGIKKVLGAKAVIQRCQWHKRENIVSYLPKTQQAGFRRKLQGAYEMPTYAKAKARLMAIRKELKLINLSAVNSLDEGLEETLTLHRLGVFEHLGRSFKTTNCIENINRQVERILARVCHWKNSEQRQRWVASALLEIQPNLNKVSGYKHLANLRLSMKTNCGASKLKNVA